MGGTDTGVAPTLKTPIMVWRAVTIRLSGDRVRPVCGLCGFVCLSQASHWSHHPRPLHPAVRRPRAEPRPGRVPRELACRPRSQQHNSATAPVSITHHHHRSLARVIARSNEPPAEPGPHAGRGAASPPAPGRRRSARPRPATHSWAHPLPCPTPPVRGAPAARSRLPSPGRMRPRAASPPAPGRRRSARPRPATHSWAHPLPCPTPPVRGAPAARSRLPSPGRMRPRGGEPPSPSQEPERSSEASDAMCDVSTSHATARRCPAAPGRAAACRARAARGAVRNRSPARSGPQNGNRCPWLCCSYPL